MLQYMQIYRSREVGQSYVTSVGTTLIAIAHALWLMIEIRPQVILYNGPGTCIPLCAIAFMFKVLGIIKMVINILCGEYCKGKKTLFEWFAALQTKNG